MSVGGTAGRRPGIGASVTSALTAALPALTASLAVELAPVRVNLVAPGALYGDRLNQLDVRVGKLLRLGRTRTSVGVDVFNVLNANTVLAENSNYAAWRAPLAILLPRYARFSAQIDF